MKKLVSLSNLKRGSKIKKMYRLTIYKYGLIL